MIEIQAEVPASQIDALEAHFCEDVRSPWCLVRVTPTSPVILSGYFEDAPAALAAWGALRTDFPDLPETPSEHPVADEDWKLAYRHHLTWWHSRGLHWVPVWERETREIPAGEIAIYLDSGMAFGTGSHETTRMCAEALLDWIEAHPDHDRSRLSLIDAGCGSGILALSAHKLGFGSVFGFDRDPESVRVSIENARENGIADAITFAEGGIEAFLPERQADIVIANIQADVLRLYATEFLDAVRPRGTLILSGILATEVHKVIRTFEATAAARLTQPATHRIDGEWSRVVLQQIN